MAEAAAPRLQPAGATAGWAAWAGSGWRAELAWALLLALPLFLRLGAAPLFDVDEGAFAEASREMLASGDWWHTTLNGADRFDKPIGVYWLQALSLALLGPGEAALRLPSALATWAQALALGAFASAQWGVAAGRLAGLITISSLGWLLIGRAATADALLNLLLTLAGLDLWRHLAQQQAAPLRRAALWVGLGLLVKGPVALLVPGLAAAVWLLAGRQWARLRGLLADAPAWLVLLGVALPWYAYALQRHGMAFVDGFLLRHNLSRYAGALEGHSGSPAYYLLAVPLLALPWTPLLWPVLRQARVLWAAPLPRYLLGWSAAVLLFFSLSGTKLPHYALYGMAPLALLMAQAWPGLAPRWRQAVAGCALLTLAGMVALPWAALAWVPTLAQHQPLLQALLAGAPPPWALSAGAGLAAVMLLLVWVWAPSLSALWPGTTITGGPALLAAWLLAAVVAALATPWWGQALQGPVQQAALLARQRPEPAVQWRVDWPSFALYRGQPTPRRAPAAHELVLTRLDRLPEGPARPVLWAGRGVLLLGPLPAEKPADRP